MVTTDSDVTSVASVSAVPDFSLAALTDADRARLSAQCLEYANSSLALMRKAERCRKDNELAAACLYGWGAAEDIHESRGRKTGRIAA